MIKNFKQYKESFVPKKLEDRFEEYKKKYSQENEYIKNVIVDKNFEYAHDTEYNKRNLKENEYHHNITGDTLYFYTKERNVEIPLKAVDWKIWIKKLAKIDVDENGYIKEDFEPYYAGDDTLSQCLSWIEWYFEIDEEEVRKEYNKSV